MEFSPYSSRASTRNRKCTKEESHKILIICWITAVVVFDCVLFTPLLLGLSTQILNLNFLFHFVFWLSSWYDYYKLQMNYYWRKKKQKSYGYFNGLSEICLASLSNEECVYIMELYCSGLLAIDSNKTTATTIFQAKAKYAYSNVFQFRQCVLCFQFFLFSPHVLYYLLWLLLKFFNLNKGKMSNVQL